MIDIRVGDCREILRTLPAGSVQSCITSPAYWGLRDYGVAGQLGMEKTPEEYVSNLVAVFADVRRVLRDDGTLWLNLGDSFANDTKWGGQSGNKNYTSDEGGYRGQRERRDTGLKPKDLVMIPFRVALALQADGWWVRQTIIWHKVNCMPESVTDRPTTSHEYIFLLAKSERYFYDAEAIREPNSSPEQLEHNQKYAKPYKTYDDRAEWSGQPGNVNNVGIHSRPGGIGRNKRSVWTIPTSPYKGTHFATFPPDLVEPMIKAGTSERGCCPACGAAWVRVLEQELTGEILADGSIKQTKASRRRSVNGAETSDKSVFNTGMWHTATTIGWRPSCNCPAHEPVPCTVLDPFFGAGTVGLVADRLGRDCIGIELNPKYVKLAEKRIREEAPMFVRIETLPALDTLSER